MVWWCGVVWWWYGMVVWCGLVVVWYGGVVLCDVARLCYTAAQLPHRKTLIHYITSLYNTIFLLFSNSTTQLIAAQKAKSNIEIN